MREEFLSRVFFPLPASRLPHRLTVEDQIRRREMYPSPVAWATAHLAALFVKHFPRGLPGVHPPEALPAKIRQAILAGARTYGIRVTRRATLLKPLDADEG